MLVKFAIECTKYITFQFYLDDVYNYMEYLLMTIYGKGLMIFDSSRYYI